jgi:hypothetical protein
MSVLASAIMGLDGLLYLGLGGCMLAAGQVPAVRDLAAVYPSLFKPLREVSVDPEVAPQLRPVPDLVHDLGYRMMGYLLVFVGVARLLTSAFWGCGYVYLGLWTGLAEMGLICNELLRQESMFLHGAMAAIMANVFLVLAYVMMGVPHCT